MLESRWKKEIEDYQAGARRTLARLKGGQQSWAQESPVPGSRCIYYPALAEVVKLWAETLDLAN